MIEVRNHREDIATRDAHCCTDVWLHEAMTCVREMYANSNKAVSDVDILEKHTDFIAAYLASCAKTHEVVENILEGRANR